MNPFEYVRAKTIEEALGAVAGQASARFIAGGTNLIDLMRENVMRPGRLVDIRRLPLTAIENTPEGGLRLGALCANADTAYHPEVQKRYPLLSKAILAGASGQIRNMASNGGNLLQRTRCYYFYDTQTPCNKREPGTGCGARNGVNRIHAILGASEQCIAVHPSDMCVALAALDAVVQVRGPKNARSIPFRDFLRLPGDTPQLDNNLANDELITSIDLPPQGFDRHFAYLKVRDRTSYAFALVSVAAALEVEGANVKAVRLALGGVAHKPWRVPEAESLLVGKTANDEALARVADAYVEGAQGFEHNAFKIELARRAIRRALRQAFKMERTRDWTLHRTSTEPG